MTKTSQNKDGNKRGKRPRKITPNYLNNAGMFYLKRYSASVSHFKKIMARKIDKSCAYHEDQDRKDCLNMLDTLVEKFLRLGLLDDERYTKTKVISYRRKGYGERAIKKRLWQKGVDSDLVDDVISQTDEDRGFSEYLSALRYMQRRRLGCFRKITLTDLSKEGCYKYKQKELASLARAGFSFAIAKKALDTDKEKARSMIQDIYR